MYFLIFINKTNLDWSVTTSRYIFIRAFYTSEFMSAVGGGVCEWDPCRGCHRL